MNYLSNATIQDIVHSSSHASSPDWGHVNKPLQFGFVRSLSLLHPPEVICGCFLLSSVIYRITTASQPANCDVYHLGDDDDDSFASFQSRVGGPTKTTVSQLGPKSNLHFSVPRSEQAWKKAGDVEEENTHSFTALSCNVSPRIGAVCELSQ